MTWWLRLFLTNFSGLLRRWRFPNWLLFALSFALPIAANDGIATQQSTPRIIVLGDSITAGYGLTKSEAYPALLQQKIDQHQLDFVVVNAGVSGDTTAGGLNRIGWVLGQQGADVLLIALGGNDGLRGIQPAATKKNLDGIIKRARLKNPDLIILLIGMQMPDNMGESYTKEFASTFQQVAKDNQVHLLPFLLEGVGGNPTLNQTDRIHPTAEGQKIIAQHVWSSLLPLLRDSSKSQTPKLKP